MAGTSETPAIVRQERPIKQVPAAPNSDAFAVKCVPRQDSPNAKDPRNRTTYHPEQTEWTWENLPDILYQLKPEGKINRTEEPPALPELIHGQRVRDFPVLPNNISSTVEEFRVEAWMRLDRRIRLKDITDRMHPDFRVNENALQQRGVRFRQAFRMLAWDSGNKRSRQLEAELLHEMEQHGLDVNSNSTRGLTPGLIDPKKGEAGGRMPIPSGWGPKKYSARLRKHQSIEAQILEKSKPLTPITPITKFVHEYMPFDEYSKHPNGALPVIQGIIPDEELPKTVNMADLDLSRDVKQPQPQIKQDEDSLPLLWDPDRLSWRAPFWTPSSALNICGFCANSCFETPKQEADEFFQPILPSLDAQSKPKTPAADIFPLVSPIKLDTYGEEEQYHIFESMLDEYRAGSRYVAEMPYHSLPSP
ncbi:uncharacterized protein BJX67DRAFT_373034 [Aspergillus lucknowensis]|uniref:Clr5 domain-containing protein n=1 Tax=Aspergillus lucknowensis TaxID=176173 RepID=A0ABR4LMA8_9EURO